jgi:hypothetical protein
MKFGQNKNSGCSQTFLHSLGQSRQFVHILVMSGLKLSAEIQTDPPPPSRWFEMTSQPPRRGVILKSAYAGMSRFKASNEPARSPGNDIDTQVPFSTYFQELPW